MAGPALAASTVYSSPWFSAIYLLLFTSLVGCLLPRLRRPRRALRTVPPDGARSGWTGCRSTRRRGSAADAAAAAAAVARPLRGRRWRTVVREQADGAVTVAAEKGYLKETGNLLFHFALLAVLIGVAVRVLVRLARQPPARRRAPTPGSATPCRSTTSTGWAPASSAATCRRSASSLTTSPPPTCANGQPKTFDADGDQ